MSKNAYRYLDQFYSQQDKTENHDYINYAIHVSVVCCVYVYVLILLCHIFGKLNRIFYENNRHIFHELIMGENLSCTITLMTWNSYIANSFAALFSLLTTPVVPPLHGEHL